MEIVVDDGDLPKHVREGHLVTFHEIKKNARLLKLDMIWAASPYDKENRIILSVIALPYCSALLKIVQNIYVN